MKNKEINNSERPWGRYCVIEDNENYKIKRIEVNPNAKLSLPPETAKAIFSPLNFSLYLFIKSSKLLLRF